MKINSRLTLHSTHHLLLLLGLLLAICNVADAVEGVNLFNQPKKSAAKSTGNSRQQAASAEEGLFVDLELNLNHFKLFEQLLSNKTKQSVETALLKKSSVPNYSNHNPASNYTEFVLLGGNSTVSANRTTSLVIRFRVSEFFAEYRLYFIIASATLFSLVVIIISLALYNFISSGAGGAEKSSEDKLNEKINKKLIQKYKKKNPSFDIIDSGYYKPTRRSSSSFKLFNNQNSSNFNRSNSTTDTQLVVDYDYQFENFVNNPAIMQQQQNNSRTLEKIMSDHFYELPSINNYSSLMAAAAAAGQKTSVDFYDDGQRFKTFSVRKFEKEKQKFDKAEKEINTDDMNNNNNSIIYYGTNNHVGGMVKKFHSLHNPVVIVGGICANGSGLVRENNKTSLKLNTNDLRSNMITEIYEPSISICFDKISLSDLSSVDKQSF